MSRTLGEFVKSASRGPHPDLLNQILWGLGLPTWKKLSGDSKNITLNSAITNSYEELGRYIGKFENKENFPN